MIEVQECDEVPLALTQVFSNGTVLADNLVHILNAFFGTDAEALESRILQNLIDAVNSGLGVCIVFIEVGDFFCQISNFLFKILPALGYNFNFFL